MRSMPRPARRRCSRLIVKRSLSPVSSMSARAARQHSSTISSAGSRQMSSVIRGTATLAPATSDAIPVKRAVHWSGLILPSARSSPGTSRYSSSRSAETKIRAVRATPVSARRGAPPNANAETRTPVSTTTRVLRLARRVEPSPHLPCCCPDVGCCERAPLERRAGQAQGRFQSLARGESREDELLRINLALDRRHRGTPLHLLRGDGIDESPLRLLIISRPSAVGAHMTEPTAAKRAAAGSGGGRTGSGCPSALGRPRWERI